MAQVDNSTYSPISADKQVSLICTGREFVADRDVICTGSPYFEAMFKSGMKEALSGQVELHQVEADALQVILHFLHTGEIKWNKDESEESLKSLFLAAHLLQVPEVEQFAGRSLGAMTNMDNLDERRQLAATYSSNEVLQGVLYFLAQHLDSFDDENIFLELDETQLADLLDINRDLMLSPENAIKSILKWVKHSLDERSQFLVLMTSHLRLSTLSRQFIQVIVASEPLFREHMDVTKHFMMTVLMHRIIDQMG